MTDNTIQAGSFRIFATHVESSGLRGFEDIVSAHINTWGNTVQGLCNFHHGTIDTMTDTSLAYLQQDFFDRLDDLRTHTEEHRSRFQNVLDNPPSNTTKCCDINIHSPKQLKTDALFELVDHLPEQDKERGLKILNHAGYAVYQMMHEAALLEEDLLKTITPERDALNIARGKDVIPPLTQNVKYHKEVAADWSALQNRAANNLQHGSPQQQHRQPQR
ncbi:MAG: hypothetical protein EP349_05870 [Alphaproteobacteria bacterium]|nr:MAG: hypothetical protein EP349_05870 [Alphaproteobacteria bacterium]